VKSQVRNLLNPSKSPEGTCSSLSQIIRRSE
jgi:hypothetical protein